MPQAVPQAVPHPCRSVSLQPGLKDSRPNAAGEVVGAYLVVNGLKRVNTILLIFLPARVGEGGADIDSLVLHL